jgi:AcrR family transcriptional regulator
VASRVGLSRDQVFSVALEMADELGLDGLTIAALAARVGIQRQSVYAHVGSRDTLVQDIRIHHFRTLAAQLRSATAGRGREEALRALVAVSVAYELAHRGAFTTTGAPPSPDKVDLWEATNEVMQPVWDVLALYGIDGDGATVWFRGFWTVIVGYTTLAAGPLWGPVPAEATLAAMTGALALGLEHASGEARTPSS